MILLIGAYSFLLASNTVHVLYRIINHVTVFKKDNKLSEDSVMMVHEASQKLRTFCALFRLTFFFQVTTRLTGLKCEPSLLIFIV